MSQDTLGLIEKRVAIFDYILKAHRDSVSGIPKSDIYTIYREHTQHTNDAYRNFFLGCSISTIISRYTSLGELIRALTGALKDYENLKKKASDPTTAKRVAQASKRLFRITTYGMSGIIADKKPVDGPASMSMDVDLSNMTICHLPYIPDPVQTFLSLCDSLKQCYRVLEAFFIEEIKTHGAVGRNHELYELLYKFDSRVSKAITAPVIKDIDGIARSYFVQENQNAN